LPLLINRTIQVQFSLAPKAKYFIDGPFPPHPPSMPTERGGQLRAKRLHPIQHRTCGDINITLG
jgi:hypothetical protein